MIRQLRDCGFFLMACLLLAMPCHAPAESCHQTLMALDLPTIGCSEVQYDVLMPEGENRVDSYYLSQVGVPASAGEIRAMGHSLSQYGLYEYEFQVDFFDGFDGKYPQDELPSSLQEPFFSSTTFFWDLDDSERIKEFGLSHRAAVHMGPRDSLSQTARLGNMQQFTFIPVNIDGGTGDVTIKVDFNWDFSLADPEENLGEGSVSATGSASIFGTEPAQKFFSYGGQARADLAESSELEILGDFEDEGIVVWERGPGGIFDVSIQNTKFFTYGAGQIADLEAESHSEILTGAYDNGDISSWWYLGHETFTMMVSSDDPNVRFEIVSEPLPFEINPGVNDAWFDDTTAGQGFLIMVFPDQGIVFLAWFTYDTQRPPGDVTAMLGEPGHRWVTAQGPYSGDTAELTVYLTEGGVFDSAEPPAVTDTENPIGTIDIVWHDCESATLTYNIDPPGVMGQIELRRIVPDNVALCEALAEQ